jgi:hypothetical protein
MIVSIKGCILIQSYEQIKIHTIKFDTKNNPQVNVADVQKLKQAGFGTIESLSMTMKKELLAIRGLTEQKVDKIMEVVHKTQHEGESMFISEGILSMEVVYKTQHEGESMFISEESG